MTDEHSDDWRYDHVVDDLPGLLRSELDRAELVTVVAHLRACDTCRHELVEVGAAHAALAAVHLNAPAAATPPSCAEPARTRRPSRPWLAAAAGVVLLAGGATLTVALSRSSGPPPARRVALAAVGPARTDHPTPSGTVTMSPEHTAQRMLVTPAGLPQPPAGHFYEVWLLQPVTGKMLPIGVLQPATRNSYVVDDTLVDGYSAIDISLQRDDGDPAHSDTSLLRASYG